MRYLYVSHMNTIKILVYFPHSFLHLINFAILFVETYD